MRNIIGFTTEWMKYKEQAEIIIGIAIVIALFVTFVLGILIANLKQKKSKMENVDVWQ